MTSIEKHRTSAYSNDFRWRIMEKRGPGVYSCQQIANNLHIDKSTVSINHNTRFRTSGTVRYRVYLKITLPVQLLIFQLVITKRGIYLEELQDEIEMFNIAQLSVYFCIVAVSLDKSFKLLLHSKTQ